MTAPGFYRRGEIEYDAIDAVNQSTLKAIAKSPLHYQHGLTSGKRPTDTMRLGSVAHSAVLEPHRLKTDYAVWHGAPGGKTDHFKGNAFADFRKLAEAERRTVIKQADIDHAFGMRKAIHSNALARRYLSGGEAELTMVWRDKLTGVLCKGRIDFRSTAVADVIVDVKTGADVSAFAMSKAFAARAYDVQTAFYCDGYEAITGRQAYPKCIAVENAPPHDVVVFDLLEVIETGRELYRDMLAKLVECRTSGEWPGQAPTSELTLRLPKWRDTADDDPSGLDLEWGANANA